MSLNDLQIEIIKNWGEVVAVNKPAGWLMVPGRGDKENIPILSHIVGAHLRGDAENSGRSLCGSSVGSSGNFWGYFICHDS